ncbi:histidine kinase N-terminal 7TM domain-containing protein [Haloarchaeobius salinus]|uniref:histidine kinase N-terminal 7TM domain-containing protein n=1 Tax=Haloarchaeobius salinus TaxID=1198298 RepID=UPI00210AA7D8|nr:histidine kinase N-terminal 7TM domain-containing protein [Haloarchaeobius salinus]
MLGGLPITTLYQMVLVATTGLAFVVAGVAWRNRPNTGARYLALTALGAAAWTAPSLAQSLTPSLFVDELFSRLAYIGVTLVPPSWFLLAAEYTGHDRLHDRRVRTGLWSVSAVMVVVAWSGLVFDHGLVYSRVFEDPGTLTGIGVDHGAVFYLWTLYAYGLVFGALSMFVGFFYRSTDLYRRQAAVVVLAALAPLVGNLLYVTETIAVDGTPFGFALGSAALAFGVFEFSLTDVTPIARESLMTNIRDGVVVLDAEGRITDVNPAASRLLGLDGSVIGRRVSTVLDGPVGDIAADVGDRETQTLVTLDSASGRRYVDVRVWPQSDDRGRSLGHLFYLRDVTEREHRERELERQNERLDRFASLVSHDLRNPLSVAEGYVELAQDTDDVSHLDDVVVAHERMEELIEDVLAMAREGETVTDLEAVRIEEVARAAWATVETNGATLEVRTDGTVRAAPTRLRRLFENLFRNAVEHGSTSPRSHARGDAVEHGSTSPRSTPSHEDAVEHGSTSPRSHAPRDTVEHGPNGATAELTVIVGDLADSIDDGPAGFYVADDGIGIPADSRADVLDDGYTTNEDGTGLGLSVVQSIADAHGWTVRVTEGDSGGARFEFAGAVVD